VHFKIYRNIVTNKCTNIPGEEMLLFNKYRGMWKRSKDTIQINQDLDGK